MRLQAAILGMTLVLAAPGLSEAQEGGNEGPGTGQIVALEQGDRAPWSGMLIEQEDLVRWRLTIEALEYRLDAELRTSRAVADAEIGLERTRTHLEVRRREEHERLWQEQVRALNVQLIEARRESGASWYEAPLLWYVLGVASVVVVVLGVAAL